MSKRPRVITLQQLKEKDACYPQQAMFKELFGENAKVPVTALTCKELAHSFNFLWAMDAFLTIPQRRVYIREMADVLTPGFVFEGLIESLGAPRLTIREDIRNAFWCKARKDWEESVAVAFSVAYNSPKK